MACCVFAFHFSSFDPVFAFRFLSFSLFAYLLGLCLYCHLLVLLPALFVLVSLWVFVCVVAFSLTDYTKKERAQYVLRPLLSCCGLVYMFSASLSVVSFAFENIHPAPQER